MEELAGGEPSPPPSRVDPPEPSPAPEPEPEPEPSPAPEPEPNDPPADEPAEDTAVLCADLGLLGLIELELCLLP